MNNNYYYGIDYKKIRLYCKIKDIAKYYQISNEIKIGFDYEKYYDVLVDYRQDELVVIEVQTTDGKAVQLKLGYAYIDFHYFFEGLPEQEKHYYDDLPF